MRVVRTGLCLVGIAAALLASTACGVNEGNFLQKWTAAQCDAYEKCYSAEFNESYSSQEDCRDAFQPDEDDFEDCEFDHSQANDCLKVIDDFHRSCDGDDYEGDECEHVYTDCG
jgi:hypothetical protein